MKKNDISNNLERENKQGIPWKISDVIFVYFFIFVLSMIFAGVMLYLNADMDIKNTSIIFQIFLSASILILIYLIITKKYNLNFKEAFGISFTKIPLFINQGIFVAIVMILTTSLIGIIFSELSGNAEGNPYMETTAEKIKWLTILAVFFAPIVEEIFFRGFMQPAIVRKTGVFLGITITAFIFGISHTQYLDYNMAMVSVFAIGVILGIARHKTRSVMPGIFAHFFNNLLAVIYFFV